MAKTTETIRSSVLGADRPFRTIQGGKNNGPPPTGQDTGREEGCPITFLGDYEGVYHFLDSVGHKRHLTARQLANRSDVRGIFRGDETFLREKFPERKEFEGDDGEKTRRVVAFNLDRASAWLQWRCSQQGLYGDNLLLRRPGIWRGDDGLPIVHCGDMVLIEGNWEPAGTRTGEQIWVAAPRAPRPADMPCDHTAGTELQNEIQRLWSFKLTGGAGLLLGFIATAMLGTAARWRPNTFLCGDGGSGKSTLMDVLRAATPMHVYSNDASPAGVTSTMNGHAKPIFIDESSDRRDQGGAEALLDLVLASSSGEGTRGVRSLPDGRSRTVEMAGCMLYGSVAPPTMLATHLGRISIVELLAPSDGADHRAEQEALAEWARAKGPALWARVITSAERWRASLVSFRDALSQSGCAPREMDQMGALLAGWWILTHEGLPGDRGAKTGVGLAKDFIRPASEAAEESGPRRAISHLMAYLLQYDGTTRQEQIGTMIARCFEDSGELSDEKTDARALGRHGLRPIRPCKTYFQWGHYRTSEASTETILGWFERPDAPVEPLDNPCRCENCRERGMRQVPRIPDDSGRAGGVWLLPVAIRPLFKGVAGLDGDRWQMALLRTICQRSKVAVRVGGVSGKAIWLPREAIDDGG